MLYIEFFIANTYGIIIHFLSKDGPSTCFPLWLGPQYISNHGVIVIDFVQGAHYVNVDLQGTYLMSIIFLLWRYYNSTR